MGAVLTQHPRLSRAVVAMVPVMDMLRAELHPNGGFSVTEYGAVEDPELFRAMRGYSPYHNVKDGVPYPAVLLTAGEFDPGWTPATRLTGPDNQLGARIMGIDRGTRSLGQGP